VEGVAVILHILAGHGLVERLGNQDVGIARNALDQVGTIGASERADRSFAYVPADGQGRRSGIGEDMGGKNTGAAAGHGHPAGNAAGRVALSRIRINHGDAGYIVVAEAYLQIGREGKHDGAHHTGVVQSKEMADLMSGDGLQILSAAAGGRGIGAIADARIENDIGFDDLAGEAAAAAMAVGFSGGICRGGDGDSQSFGVPGEIGVGANKANEIDAGLAFGFIGNATVGATRGRQKSVGRRGPSVESSLYDVNG